MPTTFTFLVVSTTPSTGASPVGRVGRIFRKATTGRTFIPAETFVEVPTQLGWDSYEQRTTLDGVDYSMRFQWNERSQAWCFSLFYTDGTALLRNKKVTTNTDLLYTLTGPLRPPGSMQLLCVEPENFNEPTRDDLGEKFVLTYAGFGDA